MFGINKEDKKSEQPKPDKICKFCNSNELYFLSFSMNVFSVDSVNGRDGFSDCIICKSCGRCMLE